MYFPNAGIHLAGNDSPSNQQIVTPSIKSMDTMNTVNENETLDGVLKEAQDEKTTEHYTWGDIRGKIVWKLFILVGVYHLGFMAAVFTYAFGLYSVAIKWQTIVWAFAFAFVTSFGTTAGAHRLWTHRAYKAKLPLRILLMVLFSTTGVYPLYYWIRDHRVHHKYSETDADPHNAKRGFFFSHIGWLAMKRHPDCIRRGREIDMSDIQADPVVMFQLKYVMELRIILCFTIPILVPMIFWKETLLHAVLTQWFLRFVILMNASMSVNSFAHLWGTRPYNKLINPAENIIVSLFAAGEGSHNYHHTFPWDYKASEFPYFNFNTTTLFIDAMAKIGWAYDRREPSRELVDQVVHQIGYKSAIEASLN